MEKTKKTKDQKINEVITEFLECGNDRGDSKKILLEILQDSAADDCGWVSRDNRAEYVETVGAVILLIDDLRKIFQEEAQKEKED